MLQLLDHPSLQSECLKGSLPETFEVLREAALRIVGRHGCLCRSAPNAADGSHILQRARHAGFTISYHRCKPGSLRRVTRAYWNTTEGKFRAPVQHVLYIEVGRVLAGLGWRGGGPIVSDRFEQGPWESELLKAADMDGNFRCKVERQIAHPLHWTRWSAPDVFDCSILETGLATPMTFEVIGYTTGFVSSALPGTTLPEICENLHALYSKARRYDGKLQVEAGRTTSFGLHAWPTQIVPRKKKRGEAAPFRYWIGPESIPLAATLMLTFSRFASENDRFSDIVTFRTATAPLNPSHDQAPPAACTKSGVVGCAPTSGSPEIRYTA